MVNLCFYRAILTRLQGLFVFFLILIFEGSVMFMDKLFQ